MIKEKNIFDTPVLFLIFNRLETTKKVFNQIRDVKPLYFFIACDGGRNELEKYKVDEIRGWVLDNIDWQCEVKTLFRDENLGCGKAVSSAITWFFENVEKGIILEDDCLPSNSFFYYCEELLIKYFEDTRIMHIAGTNLFSEETKNLNTSYYFSKYSNIWGWATWRSAWVKYDFDLKKFGEIRKTNYLRSYFDYYPSFINRMKWYSAVFNLNEELRQIDTWDYQWCFTSAISNGFAIVPYLNLIENIGNDNNATHSHDNNPFLIQKAENINLPLVHPNVQVVNKKYDLIYEKYFFGGFLNVFKVILVDFGRKFILKRRVTYLDYIFYNEKT